MQLQKNLVLVTVGLKLKSLMKFAYFCSCRFILDVAPDVSGLLNASHFPWSILLENSKLKTINSTMCTMSVNIKRNHISDPFGMLCICASSTCGSTCGTTCCTKCPGNSAWLNRFCHVAKLQMQKRNEHSTHKIQTNSVFLLNNDIPAQILVTDFKNEAQIQVRCMVFMFRSHTWDCQKCYPERQPIRFGADLCIHLVVHMNLPHTIPQNPNHTSTGKDVACLGGDVSLHTTKMAKKNAPNHSSKSTGINLLVS